ncbi:MAG: hypothetical protein AMJ75_10490 [Phycisphaerae bacterium SM1_79]|nr:MAG: hypothetical protein AMJ75_10490 [Phycisphaerae bacterium SM1_79]
MGSSVLLAHGLAVLIEDAATTVAFPKSASGFWGAIRNLPFADTDPLTPAPEGDMATAEARSMWPERVLWLDPSLDGSSGDPDYRAEGWLRRSRAEYRFVLIVRVGLRTM